MQASTSINNLPQKGHNTMKQNRSFSIMSILKSDTVTGLCSAVKDTVVSTLADAGSQVSDYLERQKELSVNKGYGQSRKNSSRSGMSIKSHEEWKAEAIARCLQNK